MEETYGQKKPSGPEAWVFTKIFKPSVVYDTNLLTASNDPKDDLVYTYAGSIGLSRQSGDLYFETFYDLTSVQYVENEKLNNVYHVWKVKLKKAIDRLVLGFDNVFKPNNSVSVGDRRELNRPESDRIVSTSDSMALSAAYTFSPKTSLTVTYDYSLDYLPIDRNTSSVANFSTDRHTITPKLVYIYSPKTTIYASYSHEFVDYFESGTFSAESDSIGLGFAYRMSAKTTMNFDTVYRVRTYENDDFGNTEGYMFKLALNKKLTSKVSLTLSASTDTSQEDLASSSTSMLQQTDYLGANLSYIFTPFISVDGGAGVSYNDRDGLISRTDLYNPSNVFTRGIAHEIYDWHIGLNWHPKFGKIALTYSYVNKNSTFTDFEHEKSTILLSAEFKF